VLARSADDNPLIGEKSRYHLLDRANGRVSLQKAHSFAQEGPENQGNSDERRERSASAPIKGYVGIVFEFIQP